MEGVDGRAEWPWMKVTNMNKGRGEGNYAPQIRESIPTAKSERARADASIIVRHFSRHWSRPPPAEAGQIMLLRHLEAVYTREERSAGHSFFPSVTALLSESEIGSRETKRNEI